MAEQSPVQAPPDSSATLPVAVHTNGRSPAKIKPPPWSLSAFAVRPSGQGGNPEADILDRVSVHSENPAEFLPRLNITMREKGEIVQVLANSGAWNDFHTDTEALEWINGGLSKSLGGQGLDLIARIATGRDSTDPFRKMKGFLGGIFGGGGGGKKDMDRQPVDGKNRI